MSAHDGYETLLGRLADESVAAPGGRVVQRQDGTQEKDAYKAVDANKVFENVDALFGRTQSYVTYKKERPEHRLMLWHRLQGRSIKETALLTGYTPQTVSNVCGQPWFQEAFCRLSSEMGKDSVQAFLQGEALPALERTVGLANNAESEAVRLAANKEILDRFLGKATVKVEQRVTGQIDNVVYDAAQLLEESKKIQDQLRARGVLGAN